jgi:hypothetical protein
MRKRGVATMLGFYGFLEFFYANLFVQSCTYEIGKGFASAAPPDFALSIIRFT